MAGMRLWRRSAEWICVFLVVLAATTGCSWAIAASGREDVLEPAGEGVTRAVMRHRLGSPSDSGTCPDGRPFDRFRVRQPMPGFVEGLYWPLQGSGLGGMAFIILLEPVFTPITAIVSEAKKVLVTVVYSPDELVVYAFTNREGRSFNEAVSPLRLALDQTESTTWVPGLTAYIDEFRRRAACTGTTLTPEKEAALDDLIPIAEEGTWGIATTDEALEKLEQITGRLRGSP